MLVISEVRGSLFSIKGDTLVLEGLKDTCIWVVFTRFEVCYCVLNRRGVADWKGLWYLTLVMTRYTHWCLPFSHTSYEFRVERTSSVFVFDTWGYLRDVLLGLFLRSNLLLELRQLLIHFNGFGFCHDTFPRFLPLSLGSFLDLRWEFSPLGRFRLGWHAVLVLMRLLYKIRAF